MIQIICDKCEKISEQKSLYNDGLTMSSDYLAGWIRVIDEKYGCYDFCSRKCEEIFLEELKRRHP